MRTPVTSIEIKDGVKIVTLIDGGVITLYWSETYKQWFTVPA